MYDAFFDKPSEDTGGGSGSGKKLSEMLGEEEEEENENEEGTDGEEEEDGGDNHSLQKGINDQKADKYEEENITPLLGDHKKEVMCLD